MSGVAIVRPGPDDAECLRDIRLEALTGHPTAFRSDAAIESASSLDDWRRKLEGRGWFAAAIAGDWAGIAAFSREIWSPKIQHIGTLGAMYVRIAYRGKGVGNALIDAVLTEAANHVEQITLTVNAENKPAVALYERHGFRTYGRLPRALRVAGRDYDDLLMVRAVSKSD